jgi:PqqD family protein of HPr-rel-A system
MTLVFHRPSGTTHFLSAPAPEMLILLSEAPMSAAALCRRLCEQFDLPEDDEAFYVVESRLDELIASGLARLC